MLGERGRAVLAPAVTDAQGRFALRGLGPYAHHVQISARGPYMRRAPVVVPADTSNIEIRLQPAAVVTVRIADPRGRPLSHADVIAYHRVPDTGDLAGAERARVGPPGTFRLGGLDAKLRYVLFAIEQVSPTEIYAYRNDDWVPKDETLVVPLAAALRGVVRDEDGRGVGGAKVVVDYSHGTGHTWMVDDVLTDAEGRFHLPALPAGELILEASRGPWRTRTPLAVRVPTEQELTLTLHPGSRPGTGR